MTTHRITMPYVERSHVLEAGERVSISQDIERQQILASVEQSLVIQAPQPRHQIRDTAVVITFHRTDEHGRIIFADSQPPDMGEKDIWIKTANVAGYPNGAAYICGAMQ